MKNTTTQFEAVELTAVEKRNTDLRTAQGYDHNPFIVTLKGKMYLQPKPNTIIAKGQQIVDTTTGEVIEDSVLMGRRKIVDRSQFAKIYFSQIQAVFDLSKCATKVLIYLAQKMTFDTMVIFNAKQECQKIGYKTQQAVQNGVRELIECGIIAQGPMLGIYWINPLYVCKGERFAMYTEFATKEYDQRSEERKAQVQRMLHQQNEQRENSLDSRTFNAIRATEKRAELAHSQGEEEYNKNFPDTSI